jgi:hypothetical protein
MADFMSHLVCGKCGRYYELQHGESPEDFQDKCECGENLEFREYLEEKIIQPKPIVIGASIIMLICFISLYFIPNVSFAILMVPIALIIGGSSAAYLSGLKYKNGIVNGVLAAISAGCISIVIAIIIKSTITTNSPLLHGKFLELSLPAIFVFLIVPTFFGFVGSLVGTTVKIKEMKFDWKIYVEGVILTSILFYPTFFLAPIMGGLFSSTKTKDIYWEGIKHGFFIGSFGNIIPMIIAFQ